MGFKSELEFHDLFCCEDDDDDEFIGGGGGGINADGCGCIGGGAGGEA
jgi:hypothetical protein